MELVIDYATLTHEQLEAAERYAVIDVKAAKKQLSAHEQKLAAIRTELRRRKLAAFWQANPGLRLEVGDALLNLDNLKSGSGDLVALETSISRFEINPDGTYLIQCYASLPVDGRRGWVITLDIARRMRLAYLQAHGEAV